MNLQNSLEIVKAVEILGVEGKKIAKDGVNLADLPEALELVKHLDVFVAAFKDAGEVVAEIKDLDQAELIALGSKCYEVVVNIVKASKP